MERAIYNENIDQAISRFGRAFIVAYNVFVELLSLFEASSESFFAMLVKFSSTIFFFMKFLRVTFF